MNDVCNETEGADVDRLIKNVREIVLWHNTVEVVGYY
jgi:hypothetical protein